MRNQNELFWYTYTPITLAPSATISQALSTDADAPFVISDFMGYAQDGAGNRADFLIQFQDDTTTKRITSQPTFSRLVLTNAETINPIPVRRTIAPKTTLTATVSNPGAAAITVYLSLRGYKQFEPPKK